MTDHDPIPLRSEHDPMPPPWVRRRRRNDGSPDPVPVDEAALLQAMQGGVPAKVERYVPKSGIVDAGQFATAMAALKDAIAGEAMTTATALRKQADELERSAQEQCDAIDMAVTDANIRQQAARTMAEAFARVSSDIISQVRTILAPKPAPGPILEAGAREGASSGDDNP